MMPNPADGYNERHIRKMKWRRIVTILSCIVVFCTTYALIIPAVTMSRDTACGKEEHTHTEACYDENGALICGREEHTHTDACLLAVRELTYEDGQLTICLRVESMDPLPEDLTLSVEEPQAAVQSAADGSGQTFTRRLTLLSQGQQVDTSSYDMTATVQVKPQALEPLEAALEQLRQEAPESDTGISLTLSQTTGRQEEQLAEELKAVIYPGPNTNETKLVYGEGSETTWDKTETFTYQFDLVKTKTDKTVLDGAEFKLYDAKTGGNEIALIDESNGVYRVATAAEKAAEGFVSATIKAGKVTIKGLDSGTYYLEETKAPAGYNVLAERVEVKIDHANLTATVEGDTYVSGGVQVINQTGAELPSTGGIGTTIFYVVGGLLVVAAGVLLVTRKRMSKSED